MISVEVSWAKSRDSIPRQHSIDEILSLKCRVPRLNYVPPRSGVVVATNGATIVISGNQTTGATSLSQSPSTIIRNRELGLRATNLELRIMGRTIYFNQEVSSLELMDMTGRKVLTQYNIRHTSLGNIRTGVYMLRCTYEGNQISTRIVLR